MLLGIDPLLSGDLLAALDAMGHSDSVCLADAHFPADRLARRLLTMPGVGTPALLKAVCTVLPLDAAPAVDLMATPDGALLPVHGLLLAAAGTEVGEVRRLDRHEFYDEVLSCSLVVRTGETQTYGNVVVRKGVVHR